MRAPRITRDENGFYDLKLTDGKFEWAEDGIHAAQNFLQRLLTFKGEYTLDGYLSNRDDKGTKWYEILFDHSKSDAEKEFELMRVIRSTPGFKAMITPLSFSMQGQTMVINGAVQTEWGAVNIGDTVEML